ncbi:restriction endonuclease subunit S [Verrucomicrobiaceae bacterium R5-34]|nr:restriction endonuclease subunit S [Verrucomicrobiaceae bacterium R5-34]
MSKTRQTKTGGRAAIEGHIPGQYALAVGMPDAPAPEGWEWRKLTDVARLESGHTPTRKKPEYWDGDIPWIGIRDATKNHGKTLNDTKQHTNELGIANSSARLLPANTVCLSRTASVGYVVVMGRTMATSQDFVNWICGEELDHRFLKYVLLAEKHSFLSFASGTTHQTIYFPEVKAFHICMPSLPTQRRIAGILSAYDDLIENNLRRIKILEEMAQSLYREWFVHFRIPTEVLKKAGLPPEITLVDSPLGPIPDGWEVKKLGELSDQMRRGVPKGKLDEPTPYVGLEHIPRISLALNNWEVVEELGSNKLTFEPGEVLFGKIRPYFHKVSIAPFEGICSADTIVIRAKKPEWRALVVSCVFSESFVAHASATANGAKMPRADWKVLKDYPLVLPPSKLLEKFSSLFEDSDQQTRNLVSRNQTLSQTRDLLLPKLLTQT